MNLHSSFKKAHSQAVLLFLRAKTDQYLYILRWGISRKNPLYAVFTQNEVDKYKITTKDAFCVGDTDHIKEAKEEYMRFATNPKVIKHDAIVKYLRSSLRTQKLEQQIK